MSYADKPKTFISTGLNLSTQTLKASLNYLKGLSTYEEYASNIDSKDKPMFSLLLTSRKHHKSSPRVKKNKKRSIIPPFVYDFLDDHRPALKSVKSKHEINTPMRPRSLPKLKPKSEDRSKSNRSKGLPKINYESYKDLHNSGSKFNDKTKEPSPFNNLYKPYTVNISPRSKITIYSSTPIPRSISTLRDNFEKTKKSSVSPRRSFSPDKIMSNIKLTDRASFIIQHGSRITLDY